MAKLTPQQFRQKWQRNIKSSTEDIKIGINNVTEAPGKKAAAAQELMKAKLVESIDSGKWGNAVSKVTLEDWKEKILTKGIPRISAGVDAAGAKVEEMAEQLLRNVDASVAVVNQTPRGDLEANINRMTTFAREMHKRKIKK